MLTNFTFEGSFLDIIVRCVVVYLFMIVALKVLKKNDLTQLSTVDFIFILLISNAVQNAMVGNNTNLGGGLTAATALFVTNFFIKKWMFRDENISKLLHGEVILLIKEG